MLLSLNARRPVIMRSTNDLKDRGKIKEKFDTLKTDMSKSESDLEIFAKDIEVIKNTLKKMDFGGTNEGFDEINQHIEIAEDITKDAFDEKDDLLEQKQGDSDEFKNDLSGKNELSEKNLNKVSDVKSEIKTKDTMNELEKAKQAVLKDINFLSDQIDRASRERERSDIIQQQLRARIDLQ
jgi:hypothetical protein